jgi:toxin ParE1/3/4
VTLPRFSPLAVGDLEQIFDYTARDKPAAAERFVRTLREKCEMLSRFPLIGTPRDHLAPGLRAFSIGRYVIYYRPEADTVRIERVLHGARDIGRLWQ